MITLAAELGRVHIPQSLEELPNLKPKKLYLDIESTSFNDKEMGIYPYRGHRVCGYAITLDKEKDAWYIPIRHKHKHWNLPVDKVSHYVQNLLDISEEWTNHNVKFDAHFLIQDSVDFKDTRLNCTLQQAKLVDSERLDYALKTLGKDWLAHDMEGELEVKSYLNSINSKDYGRVPADILGRYAADDVFVNRQLESFILNYKDSELDYIWEQESKLLGVLFDMERAGLQVDTTELKKDSILALREMIRTSSFISQKVGFEFTNSNKNLQEILLQEMELPVVAWGDPSEKTGKVNPSFDSDAMKKYLALPQVVLDKSKLDIITAITEYKTESQYNSLYLEGWPKVMSKDDRIHPIYNPNVRTGRVSASAPNITQLNSRAKRLIIPDAGREFYSQDGSQIEFRFIAHFLNQPEMIEKYIENPDTDFHQWVADMGGCGRQQGKTLNFANGFGAGKKRIIKILMGDKDVIATTLDYVESLIEKGVINQSQKIATFEQICKDKAESLYSRYHDALYNLRDTSKLAESSCRRKGYVRNLYGRRRHLFRDIFGNERWYKRKDDDRVFNVCHKAFNTAVQGTASDYVKSRMVALSTRYNPRMAAYGVRLLVMVHDELMFDGPQGFASDPEITSYMDETLRDTAPLDMRVPVLWDGGFSKENWKNAK